MTQRSNKTIFSKIVLIVLIAIPIVLLILPSDFFDSGKSMCLSVLLLGIECYGCGITRATMHFIHLEFEDAIYYNGLVVLVAPILIVVWAKYLISAYRALK
jgi:Protein of unknown function (DUF2752)